MQEPPRLQVAAVIPEPRPRPAYVAAAPQPPRDADAPRRQAPDSSTRAAREAAAATQGMRWIVGPRPRESQVHHRIEPKPEPKPEAENRTPTRTRA